MKEHKLQITFHDVLIAIAVFHHIFQFLNYIDVGNIDNAFNNKEIRNFFLSIGSLSVGSFYDHVNFLIRYNKKVRNDSYM